MCKLCLSSLLDKLHKPEVLDIITYLLFHWNPLPTIPIWTQN